MMRWVLVTLWILGGVILSVNTFVLMQLAPQFVPDQVSERATIETATARAAASQSGDAESSANRDEMDRPNLVTGLNGTQDEEIEPNGEVEGKDWVEVRSAVNIRSGPSRSATRLGTYQSGAKLQAMGSESGWVQVLDPDTSETGWIYENYLAEVTPD
jgi:uncharacterized protein YgiM (DUF1202 family)